MPKNITTLKTVKRNRTFLGTVAEMIGKIAPVNDFMKKNSITWQLYTSTPSVDYSKTNYTLCRAIYYASIIQDTQSRGSYGADFLLGSVFGKPIINSAAAFAFGQSPYITIDNEKENTKTQVNDSVEGIEAQGTEKGIKYTESFVADWFSSHESEVFKTCRNTLRDGDQYLLINDDLSATMLPPEQVEIIDDPVTGEVIGYDVTIIVPDRSDSNNKTIKYVSEYRKVAPFFKLTRYDDKNKNGVVEKEDYGQMVKDDKGVFIKPTADEEVETRILPIGNFHNERDARERYGTTEFQNCYLLFANYHAVLEGAIKNNIYNSTAIPIVRGVDNQTEWLETNGVKDEHGEYSIAWDKNKLLVGGKDFNVDMVTSTGTAAEAQILLNLLFWLICQTSETPEFVMGTAVASSNASVDSQMPVVLRKADRKRKEFRAYFENLVRIVLAKAFIKGDTQILKDVKFRINYPDVVGEDMKLNMEIVKLLSEEGCITDKTKMKMMGMGDVVEDIDKEIEDAHTEGADKAKLQAEQFAETSKQANADQVE